MTAGVVFGEAGKYSVRAALPSSLVHVRRGEISYYSNTGNSVNMEE